MFCKEVMGVQRDASSLPIRVNLNCGWTIEQESVTQIDYSRCHSQTGATKTEERNTREDTYER